MGSLSHKRVSYVAAALLLLVCLLPCAAQTELFARAGDVNPNSFPKITYSADGRTAAVVYTPGAGQNCSVAVFDVKSRALKNSVPLETTEVTSLAMAPNGDQVAASSRNDVQLVAINDSRIARKLGSGRGSALALAYSPNSALVAASTADNRVTVYDANSGHPVSIYAEHTVPVRAIAFTHDNDTLIAGSDDRTITLYQVRGGKTLQVLNGHTGPVRKIVTSPVDRSFMSAGGDRELIAWAEGRRGPVRKYEGLWDDAQALAYSPDGRYLLSGDARSRIILWHTPTGTQASTLTGEEGAVAELHFSADGKSFLSASPNATYTVWDLLTRAPLQSSSFIR